MMRTWFCYQCQSYHKRTDHTWWLKCPASDMVPGTSVSYDSSLCQLWATGLTYPLKVKR
jgi:hypothetical protein